MNEDWLERALRGAETPVSDAGFTLRVMRALPPASPVTERRSDWILIAGAAAGSAVAASQFPLAPFLNLVLESLQITWVAGAMALAISAGVLLADAWRRAL